MDEAAAPIPAPETVDAQEDQGPGKRGGIEDDLRDDGWVEVEEGENEGENEDEWVQI